MKKNIGNVDKIVRLALAALVAVLYFTNVIGGTLAIVLGVVAAIFVATSMMSFCPIWAALGVKTNKSSEVKV